jgi:hypothetical protein
MGVSPRARSSLASCHRFGRRVDLVAALNEDGAGWWRRTATLRGGEPSSSGRSRSRQCPDWRHAARAEFRAAAAGGSRHDPVNVLTAQITLPDSTDAAPYGAAGSHARPAPGDAGVSAAAARTTPPFSQREMLTAFTMPASGDGRGRWRSRREAPRQRRLVCGARHSCRRWPHVQRVGCADLATVVVVNRRSPRYLGDRPVGRCRSATATAGTRTGK